jgi:N6-adenosine-specific RNA methylase IME4
MRFDVILADPPWLYNSRNNPGARFGCGAYGHYPMMDTANIAALPVGKVAADLGVLFLWATWPKLPDAFQVLDAWGFTYKTLGFIWVKLNPGRAKFTRRILSESVYSKGLLRFLDWLAFFGVGFYAKSNTEPCLLATRGTSPLRPVTNDVSSVIFAPRGDHSEKPLEVHRRIERLFGDEVTRLELFARRSEPGWTVAGNEIDGADIRVALRSLAIKERTQCPQSAKSQNLTGEPLALSLM